MYRRSYSGSFNRPKNHFRKFSFQKRGVTSKIHVSQYIKKAQVNSTQETQASTRSFSNLQIETILKNNLSRRGFTNLTAIQEKTIDHILEGKDVVGIANTGTGKTAAFLIPLLNKITKNRSNKIIIIVPTRELAMQIRDEMRAFSQSMNIYSTLCIGGDNIRNQIYDLRRNPNFVIGTPGRLKDLIERKCLWLDQYGTVVLDEVDRMLDMGFIHDIKYLIALLPKNRQTLFFSATLSQEINTLMQSFLNNPVSISVKVQDTAHNVEQDIVRIHPGAQKMDTLETLLKKDDFKKVLIFGRTKHGVERLSTNLYKKGFKVASIHGDKPQSKRTQAIRLFKEDVVNILVATDVASRGIDITDITHVINYDQPATYDDYIHRIGRTGRANKKGVALTFID
ncbi:MAG: DEAD/DEAH box helicase [Candidatus Roizmanbacteria bacterium]|nr:MAG: DEAD/DEAH box helicase [Candidatus Roizmanbacteria bacterium]